MPAYDNSPFRPVPKLLIPGQNTYLFGSWPGSTVAPTRFIITNVAITSNVATITGTVVEGNIPAVGSLISIRGSQNAANFNVTNVAIASVSITAATGQGTITFALTHADVASTPDQGTALVPVPEAAETLAAVASIACAIQNPEIFLQGARQVSTTVEFTGLSGSAAATVDLQVADFDQDSEYTTVTGPAATVASGAQTTAKVVQFTGVNGRFFRFKVSGLSGTGNIIARISG